jgi:1,4-dihydroxy-2-naphthoyl-CoA hydrolase
MFKYSTRIFLHHTDAAGRLFFANQFFLIHEAKELFLESLGLPISDVLGHPDVTFPLVHAEADYKAVLMAGDRIEITVGVEKIGETSVVFAFMIFKDGQVAGTGKTVSVAVDRKTSLKVPLPSGWRAGLEKGLISV